jgi:hypothetical protein
MAPKEAPKERAAIVFNMTIETKIKKCYFLFR